MKKILILWLSCILLIGCFGCTKKTLTDAKKFKQEYESLNNTKDENGNTLSSISINENNTIRYVDANGIVDAFSNGTHIIYLGWPTCGWCRRMIPVLIEAANQYSGIYIYYFDIKQARDAYEKDPNSELGKQYKAIVDEIGRDDFDLSSYVNYYEDGTMKLPSSLVYFIKEGEIIGVHRRTVDTHVDSYEPLSQQQTDELTDIYKWYIDEMIRKVDIGCSSCD